MRGGLKDLKESSKKVGHSGTLKWKVKRERSRWERERGKEMRRRGRRRWMCVCVDE